MGTKTYNNYEDLLTFTRASKGHALRPVSYGTELVINGDFATDSDWTKQTGWTISGGSASCDGSSATNSYIQQEISGVRRDGTVYLIEFDVTARTGGGNVLVFFGSGSSSSISDANTTGRKSVARLLEGTNDRLYIGCPSGNTMTIDNISIKEVTFDESDGTLMLFEHPENVPRVEYDADGNRLGLLVEEARTNLLLNSEDANSWAKTAVSVSQNTTTAPNKTLTADTVTRTSGGADIRQTISVTTGNDYTITIFAKADTDAEIQIDVSNSAFSSADFAEFNIKTGAFVSGGTGATYSVVDVGDGWRRYSLTATCTNTQNTGVILRISNEEPVYLWGFQFEQGSFPTSYIKTTGSTATRSADTQNILLSEFGYNHNKGTVLIEFSQDFEYGGSGFPRAFEIGEPAIERVNLFVGESSGALVAGANFNNVNQVGMSLKTETDGKIDMTKVAYGFADDNFAASDDGDTVVTDTSASFSGGTPRTNFLIGPSGFCGHIKSIKYYPRRLTNAQLEELSS